MTDATRDTQGTVAEQVGEQGDKAVRPSGHWMYCRKCRNEEVQKGIVIPEKSVDNTTWVEVLALGPECGKVRTFTNAADRKRQDMLRCLDNPIKPGDLVLCPQNHPWGIVRSVWCEWEYFVDECVPLVVMESGAETE